jgi:hypothetical protein
MRIPFTMDGRPGQVDVSVDINTDPEALGCRPAARGFPYCSASVTHPARGYAAALGWIQLVRAADSGASFELDPFEPLGPVSHPFCFFGFLPALFDAPSRDPVADLDWDAHTFLCRLGQQERQALPLLGFTWGFSVEDGEITPRGPDVLDPGAWEEHRPVLAAQHPAWSF